MSSQNNKTLSEKPIVFRRNLLTAFFFSVLLLLLYLVPGYNRVIIGAKMSDSEIDGYEKRTLNNNLPKLTAEDKRYFKIGNYWYLKYLRENTPQNAVILLPPRSVVDTSETMKNMSNPDWVEYFIYPRLCVSEDEKTAKKSLYDQATHVAIVHGWGYEKLHYQPEKQETETVLPIKKAEKQ